MLSSQEFSRRHHGDLYSRFDVVEGGQKGDQRFTASDITLQQSGHSVRFRKVGAEFFQNSLLVPGKRKGESLQCRFLQPSRRCAHDFPAPAFPLSDLFEQTKLKIEEFFELECKPGFLQKLHARGEMDLFERGFLLHQFEPLEHRLRQFVF